MKGVNYCAISIISSCYLLTRPKKINKSFRELLGVELLKSPLMQYANKNTRKRVIILNLEIPASPRSFSLAYPRD